MADFRFKTGPAEIGRPFSKSIVRFWQIKDFACMCSVPTQAALGPPHLMDWVGLIAQHAVDWSLPKDSV